MSTPSADRNRLFRLRPENRTKDAPGIRSSSCAGFRSAFDLVLNHSLGSGDDTRTDDLIGN